MVDADTTTKPTEQGILVKIWSPSWWGILTCKLLIPKHSGSIVCRTIKVGGIEKSDSFGFVSRVRLRVEGFEEEIETDVIFVKNMIFGGLLGQKDIFENFKIRFEKKYKKFYLSKEI